MSVPAYPDYKDSGVDWLGLVPTHWIVSPFKWQIDRNDGGVWGVDPDGVDDTIVLRSTEQTVDGRWRMDDPAPRKLTAAERASSLLAAGDLVVTKSSGSSLHIGKTTLVTTEIAALGCCYSNFMQRLRLKRTFAPTLAWHVLNNEIARQQFDLLSNSTIGLANLNGTMIGQILLPVPPVAEQTAIAAFLDRETAKIDELVEEQRRLIALLKEKRQAVISHAVTKGLDPNAPMKDSGVEWLGETPTHWSIKPLKAACAFESGKAHEPFIDQDGEFICATARFVSTGGEKGKRCNINLTPAFTGDIIMVMSDLPNGRALAKAFLVSTDGEIAVNQRVARINSKTESSKFLYYQLDRNERLLAYDDGLNQTHLPNRAFENLVLMLPPLDEQLKIAAYLDAIVSKLGGLLNTCEEAMTLLQERRAALISAAVTGKIDVRSLVAASNTKAAA